MRQAHALTRWIGHVVIAYQMAVAADPAMPGDALAGIPAHIVGAWRCSSHPASNCKSDDTVLSMERTPFDSGWLM